MFPALRFQFMASVWVDQRDVARLRECQPYFVGYVQFLLCKIVDSIKAMRIIQKTRGFLLYVDGRGLRAEPRHKMSNRVSSARNKTNSDIQTPAAKNQSYSSS